ncbi:hypothetical protein B0T17DRAFT_260200 [Bombardia bombarda]|uniref:Uncharacterized protein n=1 Tax=Bombardia bombarda TaxID=252184 RepID=A0AA39X0S7_9PEZI|nr:hypothetical protein B0T17DRAFT_260200 [Bombardia bombarda]
MIYSLVLAPRTFSPGHRHSKPFEPITAVEVFLTGTFPKRQVRWTGRRVSNPRLAAGSSSSSNQEFRAGDMPYREGGRHSPWALARVCRQVHCEVSLLLAAIDIREVHFTFWAFTWPDLREWMLRMGKERVTLMRRWSMEGFGRCGGGFYSDDGKEQLPHSKKVVRSDVYEEGVKPSKEEVYDEELDKDVWSWEMFQLTGHCYRT